MSPENKAFCAAPLLQQLAGAVQRLEEVGQARRRVLTQIAQQDVTGCQQLALGPERGAVARDEQLVGPQLEVPLHHLAHEQGVVVALERLLEAQPLVRGAVLGLDGRVGQGFKALDELVERP